MASHIPFRKHLRSGEKVLVSQSVSQLGRNEVRPLKGNRVLATIHSTEGHGGVTAIRLTLDEYGKRGGNVSAGANSARERRRQRQHAAITKAIREL